MSEPRNDAIRCLARREYGVWELRQKLVQKGHQAEKVDAVLERLQNDGMLSDARYAEARSNSLKNRGYGPQRVRMELHEKRVPDSIVESVLDQPEERWIELAKTARRKKFGEGKPDNFKDKAKQMRFLQYRGFSPEQIACAVNIDETIE